MITASVSQTATPLRSHFISYWESSGVDSFEIGRARLLDVLVQVAQEMDNTAARFLLAGGTALLGDVAAVRSDLLAFLVIYNAADRLSVVSWHTPTDAFLVSGEALIRNLLAARADAARYGIKLMPVGYSREAAGHVAQLPQILRGFGIDAAFIKGDAPFRWESPDGSSVLVVAHVLEGQQPATPESPSLVMHPIGEPLENTAQHSSLKAYVDSLRLAFPDHLRPVRRGEVRDDPGTFSTRIYLKQANARLQSRLSFAAEPWLALALTHGSPAFPDNLRALLDHSWRLLLRNQERHAIGGTASDAAHDEHEIRARQIEDSSAHVMRESLRALFGGPYAGRGDTPETHIIVWNPHNWPVEQVVEMTLQPPDGQHPARLIDPEGIEKPFVWAEGNHTLAFGASVPPVGYTTYTLQFSAQKRDHLAPVRARGTSISSVLGDDHLLIDQERLVWRQIQPSRLGKDGQMVSETSEIANVLRFFDGGDAGDVRHYRPPQTDLIVQANLLPDTELETTPLYRRLIVHHRLRVIPALPADGIRGRGLKALDLVTTATFYAHQPGLYFQTVFENTVDDHRLRAHLQTGLSSNSVWADSPFALVQRAISGHTQPMQSLCAVGSQSGMMALLARGLPEYEAFTEGDQTTLALTLLRAVGHQEQNGKRPGAQCRRTLTADYTLVGLPDADPVELLRAGQSYTAPLFTYLSAQRPVRPSHSYLTVESDRLLLTALKPPQSAGTRGWIVRLYNPTDEVISTGLHSPQPVKSAHEVNLAEEPQRALQVSDGHQISLQVEPFRIFTLRLEF